MARALLRKTEGIPNAPGPRLQLIPVAATGQGNRRQARHLVACRVGYVNAAAGRYEQAIEYFREAIKLNPAYASAYHNLSWTLAETGRVAEAVEPLRAVVKLRPRNVDALSNLGWALGYTDQDAEAITAFREVVKRRPRDPDANYNYGVALFRTGQPAEAIAVFRKTIKLKPYNANAHHFLGMALLKQGQTAEAITAFRQVVRLKPEDPDAQHNLDNLDMALRDGANYKPESNAGVDIPPVKEDNPDLMGEAARLYAGTLALGFTVEKALETLQAAAKAARETTGRAKAEPRPARRGSTPIFATEGNAALGVSTVAAPLPDLTLVRQRAAFELLVRDSDLDNPKLPPDERKRRAVVMVGAYERLRKSDPDFQDDSGMVSKARRIQNSENYQRRKANRAVKAAIG